MERCFVAPYTGVHDVRLTIEVPAGSQAAVLIDGEQNSTIPRAGPWCGAEAAAILAVTRVAWRGSVHLDEGQKVELVVADPMQ